MDRKMFEALCAIKPAGIEATVSGVPPLSLPDAKHKLIKSLKAFGGTKQRNLPDGYTELEYIQSTGTECIDTGVIPNRGYSVEVKAIKHKASSLFGNERFNLTGYSNNYWYLFSRSATNYNSSIDNSVVHVWGYNAQAGKIYCDNIVRDVTPGDEVYDGPIFLFSRGVNQDAGSHKIYYAKIWDDNNALVRNMVPAKRNSDNVVGMYDTVSGTFFTNAGTGTFTAGGEAVPTPDAPVDIVCNNGVLKVDSQGNVYADGTVETIEVDTTGDTATAEMLLKVGNYKDVQNIIDGVVTRNVGVKVLDGRENFSYMPDLSTINYDCFACGNLFQGNVTNNLVLSTHFEGTSRISSINAANMIAPHSSAVLQGMGYITASKDMFNGNKTLFQQWLADQYAAGTPVIVVYPLATETTESVTPQPLETAKGDNVVDITQASLDDLELEVTYIK